jgi:hypothetical protein
MSEDGLVCSLTRNVLGKNIAVLDCIICCLEQDRLFLVERALGNPAAKPRRILRLAQP